MFVETPPSPRGFFHRNEPVRTSQEMDRQSRLVERFGKESERERLEGSPRIFGVCDVVLFFLPQLGALLYSFLVGRVPLLK